MFSSSPICSVCTRDWDQRLGYCEYCDATEGETADRTPSSSPTATIPGMREDNFS